MSTSAATATKVSNLGIDAFLDLSRIAFSSVEKLTALNLEVSRLSVEEGLSASRSILPADQPGQQPPALNDLPATICRNAQDYVRQLQTIATDTRKEVADLLASYHTPDGNGVTPSADWFRGFDLFKGFAQQINAMTEASSKIVGDATVRLKEVQAATTRASPVSE